MSVCPSVRMNAEISETITATILGLCLQVPKILAQRKLASSVCHALSKDLIKMIKSANSRFF